MSRALGLGAARVGRIVVVERLQRGRRASERSRLRLRLVRMV